jgi:two-component Ni(II)/redox sensor kinase NrsS
VIELRSPAPRLLWTARLRLAGLSLLVMGSLLYGAGWAMGRLLLHTQEAAIQSELEAVAETLHDSLRHSLPRSPLPPVSPMELLPGLCPAGQPCSPAKSLIHRHGISATDPDRFKLRVIDQHGVAVANSPGTLPIQSEPGRLGWAQTVDAAGGRWGTYAIHLHHSHGPGEPIWGYLQISRNLADLDAEARQLWRIGHGVFAMAMVAMALACWWLAGVAIAPLVEAYRRQEQFSADVAHELRTPLANLLALVEAERSSSPAMASSTATTTTSTRLERILGQGRRLQHLISDLLLLASLGRPQAKGEHQRCDLGEIGTDVLEDLAEVAAAAGVHLVQSQWLPSAPLLGKESELSRLLLNLLSNAIQHSPEGGRVVVSLQLHGKTFQLRIQDHGPGIPAAEREQIFDRFSRLDPSRSRKLGGTGLGLAIAQAIALRHGGAITVQSSPQTGSCFCVQLPKAA